MRTSFDSIQDFLAADRIAIAGVSRHTPDYSRSVLSEFRTRGYQIIPVNPNAAEIDGLRCSKNIRDIEPKPEAVLFLVPAAQIPALVEQSIERGIRYLWIRQDVSRNPHCNKAIADARTAGAHVVVGECPLMFLPGMGWFHQAHGLLRKVTGTYPS